MQTVDALLFLLIFYFLICFFRALDFKFYISTALVPLLCFPFQ